MDGSELRRIMLLGKTGLGKSSLANTIFGEDIFVVNSSPNSMTKLCKPHVKTMNGKRVRLIDTPGVLDTDPRSLKQNSEILQVIEKCSEGVHAFLLVLRVEKYTVQEQEVVDLIFEHFSEKALNYTIVVFTHGEDLPDGPLEHWVDQNAALNQLVQKCGGRCHVFDNKYWNNSQDPYRNNQVQVTELLKTIEETVTENRGRYYSREHGSTSYETQTRRIVLLGKAGSGKSSLGNTIFGGREHFKVSNTASSTTRSCLSQTRRIHGRNVQLIDTPGVWDTVDLWPELYKCIIESAPGPHAFLLVFKVEKFTQQEQDVVYLVLKHFSEEVLKYSTVVFTHGDQLPDGTTISEWVSRNEALKTLVQKCGGRCYVFDNKYWNNSQDPYRNNQYQVTELLNTIDQTRRDNGGQYYTVEMLQQDQQRNNPQPASLLEWLFGR